MAESKEKATTQITKAVLTVLCMHCGKDMGEVDSEGAEESCTSGTCRVCWGKHYPQWPFPPDEQLEATHQRN